MISLHPHPELPFSSIHFAEGIFLQKTSHFLAEKAGNAKKDVVLFEDNILSTSNSASANLYDLPYPAAVQQLSAFRERLI